MMGAKLLQSGQSERGFAGWINRRFDGLRDAYTRTLSGTLRYRPVVLVLNYHRPSLSRRRPFAVRRQPRRTPHRWRT
jgi:hypothetical protein